MDKRQSNLTILFCLVISLIIVFVAFRPKSQPQITLPGPIPIANAQVPELITVGAPDGKFSLTMKQVKGKETTTYTFLMKNESTGTSSQIFSETLTAGTSLSVPQNTFSPDDKYIFLKETGPSGVSYFVLTNSGASVIKDAQTLDFSSLFTAKYPNLVITDATGWGGTGLIVINTNKADGSQGRSFWFDVASKGFIQLSTRFN